MAAATDGELWAATPVGLIAFAFAVPLHERYQQVQRRRAHDATLFVGGP